ncbi:MAG: molybdopterin molybdotransferase MoeA [Bryobacterales bacterium]|nr:molybdopterin molybdotransferase MoeA [Bryobacterales bacterium]
MLRAAPAPAVELVDLRDAAGRVLAETVRADRDWPPAARSLRDGFAVRAADLPGELRVTGEVRAGQAYDGEVKAGEAVEIMTGATVPYGADAVVMVEHVTRTAGGIRTDRQASPGDFINPRGSEARRGDLLLDKGLRLDFAGIALLAGVGKSAVEVFARPRVAILATGDEIVAVDERPLDHQVRNSNAFSLAAQVERAGGIPAILPVARDTFESTRLLIERGLSAGLLVLSGGVSAGKYDIVETVLADLGATFFFDRVRIQPGQPLVFGRVGEKFFFGLPGNPVSTMVTFETLARAAVDLLGGVKCPPLPFTLARLTTTFRHNPGLTRFLPARLTPGAPEVTPIPWQGSSDIAAVGRANAFLVADEDREQWNAGELIQVLPR